MCYRIHIMSEIMTLHESRKALNTIYNLELPYHGSFITPEQAEAINTKFDIELHLGIHGIARSKARQHRSFDDIFDEPTQKEYDAAKDVVMGMRSCDVLFTECFNFPEASDKFLDDLRLRQEALKQFRFGLLPSFMSLKMEGDRQKLLRQNEHARQKKEISSFVYAKNLAGARGNRILYADIDKIDVANLRGITGDPNWKLGVKDALDFRVHRLREQRAPNIVKDYAIDNLWHAEPSSEIKPRLILMFGKNHKEGLIEAFDELGLNIKVFDMESSTYDEKMAHARWQSRSTERQLGKATRRFILGSRINPKRSSTSAIGRDIYRAKKSREK